MFSKHNPVQSQGTTRERPLPAVQPSQFQEYFSALLAALPEHLTRIARGTNKRIASLRALLGNMKLRVMESGHEISDVSAALWTAYVSRRKRKHSFVYLWVIALGVALGLAVELSLKIATLLPPD